MNKWLMISQIILWAVVLIQLVFMISFMKMVGEFLSRFRMVNNKIEELTLNVGQDAPLFREKDQMNRIVRLADHPADYTLLIFANTTCSVCHHILKELAVYEDLSNLRMIVNYTDVIPPETHAQNSSLHYINSSDLVENYYVKNVPHIVLIDKNNKISGIYSYENYKDIEKDMTIKPRVKERIFSI